MLNSAHAGSICGRQRLDVTAEAPAVSHVSANNPDRFPVSRRSCCPHYSWRRLSSVNTIPPFMREPAAPQMGMTAMRREDGAVTPAGGFLFKSADILKVSHRLIGGREGGLHFAFMISFHQQC